ncbi:sensor histidine kinase [Promicromonospora iranensis]|uniref:histidine kinase n=1 Tax=Promicromonospora iranensis TaxID=1105144 RepID=A0ABU2CP54_9MICO|nr:sensor histidine kinase [Promicromonospora iranensis]MDR7383121.1 signal transduction histidine kinase [Promicromonospora iranensis]
MLGTPRPTSDVPTDPHAPGPFDRARPRVFVAVATVLATNLGSIGAAHGQTWAAEPGLVGFLLLLVSPAALLFLLPLRPALATVLSVAATVTFLLLGFPWGPVFLGPLAVLAAVMLSGEMRRARLIAWSGAALLAGGIGAAASLIAPRVEQLVVERPQWPHDDWGPGSGGPRWSGGDSAWFLTPSALIAAAAWLAVVLLMASAARDRITRRVATRAAAQATAAERERTAVASERLRIARELHDVLAHSLSAINVQAGVGLHLLEKNPGQAREALTNIRDTSKDALAEVRTVLGIVREGASPPALDALPDAAAPLAPTWDLTGLRDLADQARADGLDVTVELAADVDDLPDHVAGVVHRVVQESLTNVRRHAPSARRVTLRVTRGEGVEVVVTDDGVPAGGPVEPGYGLLGMRERVEGSGGTLTAGPRPDGTGWEVRATLPAPRQAGTRSETAPTETGEPA